MVRLKCSYLIYRRLQEPCSGEVSERQRWTTICTFGKTFLRIHCSSDFYIATRVVDIS